MSLTRLVPCCGRQVMLPDHVRLNFVPCVGRRVTTVLRRQRRRGPLHGGPKLRICEPSALSRSTRCCNTVIGHSHGLLLGCVAAGVVLYQRHSVPAVVDCLYAQSVVPTGGPLLFVRHVHRARRHHPAGLAVPALRELAAAGRETSAHRRAVHGGALLL